MKSILILVLITVLHSGVLAQVAKKITIPEYIQLYKADAIKDMMRMGVPASITLAQGILESENGNSDLAREARNHFGIKCHKDWTGDTFHKDDDELQECFRKYKTVLESYDDHGRFLRERPRYSFLFDLDIDDYKGWAHGLKKAGYATNPRYADLLIKLIEQHNLAAFDAGGKKMPVVLSDTPVYAGKPATKPVPSNVSEPKKKSPPSAKPDDYYVIAKAGDTWFSIASSNDMRLWQVLKYNDAETNMTISEGDIIYLKPKRGRPSTDFHSAAKGENLWQISQKYGVKMKKLIKLNNFSDSVSISPGQKIRLRS